MSTNLLRNLVATALVVAMLALGSVFGYVVLGGNQHARANAATIDGAACALCTVHGGSGGNVPSPISGVGGGGNR